MRNIIIQWPERNWHRSTSQTDEGEGGQPALLPVVSRSGLTVWATGWKAAQVTAASAIPDPIPFQFNLISRLVYIDASICCSVWRGPDRFPISRRTSQTDGRERTSELKGNGKLPNWEPVLDLMSPQEENNKRWGVADAMADRNRKVSLAKVSRKHTHPQTSNSHWTISKATLYMQLVG